MARKETQYYSREQNCALILVRLLKFIANKYENCIDYETKNYSGIT